MRVRWQKVDWRKSLTHHAPMPDTAHPHFPDERSIGMERISKRLQERESAQWRQVWGAEMAANEARIARIRAEDAARMAALRTK